MEIQKVGVAGCGLMGAGIAEVCARAGFTVTVLEAEQRFLDKGLGAIEKNLVPAVAKGKMEQTEMDALRGRISGHHGHRGPQG